MCGKRVAAANTHCGQFHSGFSEDPNGVCLLHMTCSQSNAFDFDSAPMPVSGRCELAAPARGGVDLPGTTVVHNQQSFTKLVTQSG